MGNTTVEAHQLVFLYSSVQKMARFLFLSSSDELRFRRTLRQEAPGDPSHIYSVFQGIFRKLFGITQTKSENEAFFIHYER